MARGTFTDKDKLNIYLKQKGKCYDCNKLLFGYWHTVQLKSYFIKGMLGKPTTKLTFTIKDAHIHHIIPINLGGTHKPNNWVLVCKKCHYKRHRYIEKYKRGILCQQEE